MAYRVTRFVVLLSVLGCVAGCHNAQRSMVFFTGTTLGVEVSFEPNSTTPAKFIVGYKRAEGLMDPVMEDACREGHGYTITKSPHSVLAKIAGEVNSNASGAGPAVEGAQWFASGTAAEILAANPLTAATLVDTPMASAKIADAASGLSLRAVDAESLPLTKATLSHAFSKLKSASVDAAKPASTRAAANQLLVKLNGVEAIAGVPQSISEYTFDSSAKSIGRLPSTIPATAEPFEKLLEYINLLSSSIRHLDEAIAAGAGVTDSTQSLGSPLTLEVIKQKREEIRSKHDALLDRLLKDKAVAELFSMFQG